MSAPGPLRAVDGRRQDWETPADLFGLLHAEFAFTLDGAASDHNAKVHRYFTEEANAFEQRPRDEVIYCNPPYGRGLKAWIELFATWAIEGNTVVALLPAATDTEWFEWCYWTASELRLLRPRVQFVGTSSSNPNGSMVAVWRPRAMFTLGAEESLVYNVPPRVVHWRWKR